jgi:signal transduction histidine kinase/ligand-binding sensor domain-containing protein/DNA-binding response OmpR family regulator
MTYLKTSLLLFLFLFAGSSLNAQQLHFNSLTVNEGLSQHDASSIVQDSYGFIWVGTYDGLNRYDGYTIKNYYSAFDDENSLSSNRIKCLFEDSKKRIWIGTQGSGLNYYSLKEDKFYRIKTNERYSIITCIAENKFGEILIGTSNGILKIKEGETITLELLQIPLTGVTINDMVVSLDGTFYISTGNGLWKLKENVCEQISAFGNQSYSSLALDQNNKLWVGNMWSLSAMDLNKQTDNISKIEFFNNIDVRSLSLSKNNSIWVGTFNQGLFDVDTSNYKIINNSKKNQNNKRGLLSNTVLNVFCDKTNTLWIANRKGVCYVNLEEKKFNEIYIGKTTVSEAHIRALYVDDDYVYFGIQPEGFYRYSRVTKQTKPIKTDLPLGLPLTINKINDTLYAGASSGIFKQINNSSYFTKKQTLGLDEETQNQAIYTFCSDSYGNTYYGTANGLIVENKNKPNWIHELKSQAEILRDKRVFSLYYDSQDNCIWIGTLSEGLFKMNLTSEGQFLSLQVYSSAMQNDYYIHNNSIWSFFKDSKDHLWIGTDSGLFLKTKSSNKFIPITVEELKGKKIMAILEDNNGTLWLNNSLGLISFNPNTKETLRYSYKDGLCSNTLTEAIGKAEDRTIFIGTIDGINFFKPHEIALNPHKSEVFFTDFRVHGKSIYPKKKYFDSKILNESINATSQIELNHKQNNFLFEFSSTNYASTEENRFKYWLEGYDNDWIYVNSDHRFATYSNLKKGTYRFWIDAANQDGVWSGSPREIIIQIEPAPWLSTTAYAGYVFIVLLVIGAFIYFWNNKQQLKHQIELDKIEIKKEHEINEFKLVFFTDIAHEFKTPLSLIIGPLDDLMHNKHTNESIKFCYQVLSRNTQRMMHLVNQLLDFRKINANINILNITSSDISTFVQETTKAFLWQAENENIQFNVIVPKTFVCYFDSDLMGKVLYNLLSNAFKYTPKNGIIEIYLKQIWNGSMQVANISIKDSGKGILNEDKKKIFDRYFHGLERSSSGIGLHLSQKLITAHKGAINVADSNYGGTEFIISFPVSKDDYSDIELIKIKNNNQLIGKEGRIKIPESTDNTEHLERILIVEDDHDLRFYLKNSLLKDFNILEASNGKEGLELAQTELPDIIISDVMMPEMDGVEMCKILKGDKRTSHIPFLMLTAKTDIEFKKIGLDVGAWDYISKPFNTNHLIQKIKNIIETRNHFKSFLIDQNITKEIKLHYKPFDQKLILKVKTLVKEHMQNPDFSVEDLASEVGLSRMQLHRKLKSLVGQSTKKFINTIKMTTAKTMFDEGCDRIQEVMDAVGFSSYSHFNIIFTESTGKSPSDYIKQINI